MGAADEVIRAVAAPADLAVQLDGCVGNDAVFPDRHWSSWPKPPRYRDQDRTLSFGRFRIASAARRGSSPGSGSENMQEQPPDFLSISAIVERGSMADGINR